VRLTGKKARKKVRTVDLFGRPDYDGIDGVAGGVPLPLRFALSPPPPLLRGKVSCAQHRNRIDRCPRTNGLTLNMNSQR
jgi:hypothetical protein